MAKLKLSELDQISDIRDNDLLYVVQSGVSKSANVKDVVSSLVYENIYANAFIKSINDIGPGNITIKTSNIEEGTNLYYTNARVQAYLSLLVPQGLTSNTTDDLQEGDNNLYYTNSRVDDYITDNITTNDIPESGNVNLYYSNLRADNNFIDSMVQDRIRYLKIPSMSDELQANLSNTYLNADPNVAYFPEYYPYGLLVFNVEVEKLQVFIPRNDGIDGGRWANVVLEGDYGRLPLEGDEGNISSGDANVEIP